MKKIGMRIAGAVALLFGLALVAPGAALAEPDTKAPAVEKKMKKKAAKKAMKNAAQKKMKKKVAAKRLKPAMQRTNKVLRRAAKSVKKNEGNGKARLRVAVHHQRAARHARKNGKARVALHLTRKARGVAREVLKMNKALGPKEGGDKPAEGLVVADEDVAEALAAVEKELPGEDDLDEENSVVPEEEEAE